MGGSYSTTAVVGGHVSQGYETVREMFRRNVETGQERNAQLCVYVDGECVLDLWGSAEGDPDYHGDSLQCIFSSSKAVTAIAVAQLVDRGFLNYSNPVANYWPEFGQNLKANITVRDMLKHEGGIPHLHQPVDYSDLMPHNLSNGNVAKILSEQAPMYPVDTPREYHGLTAGWVINEVFRRQAPGQESLGSWLAREVAGPLKADVYLGVPESVLPRVSQLCAMSKHRALFHSILPNALGSEIEYNVLVFSKLLNSFQKRFLEPDPRGYVPDIPLDPTGDPVDTMVEFMNSSVWRRSESPHGSVHASARGLARLAAAMANRGRLGSVELMSGGGWDLLHSGDSVEVDASMGGCRTQFTQAGVNLFQSYSDDRVGERVFKSGREGFVGWLGFGGSVMQWHPRHQLGFGYTCTLLSYWDLANTKARKLQKETVRCALALKERREAEVEADVDNNVKPVIV